MNEKHDYEDREATPEQIAEAIAKPIVGVAVPLLQRLLDVIENQQKRLAVLEAHLGITPTVSCGPDDMQHAPDETENTQT